MNSGIKGHGSVENGHGTRLRGSFYQVHWYLYPLIFWLELLVDFVCMEKGDFDLAYVTELDPFWNDDETDFIGHDDGWPGSVPDCCGTGTGKAGDVAV